MKQLDDLNYTKAPKKIATELINGTIQSGTEMSIVRPNSALYELGCLTWKDPLEASSYVVDLGKGLTATLMKPSPVS